jgi:phenylalanyl-tRNA synthetase beta chain
MKIVYSWLKEIVDINVPAQELADALTGAGLEVASLQQIRVPAKVKVAKILEVSKHPNADKLTVCSVDIGEGVPSGTPSGTPLTIVCGAPNTKAGMLSPLAIVGAVLGPNMTVKKAKLRGIESFGMLCSERELGLSDDHSGIMSLPGHFKIGDELSIYYPEDAVIEIEITPSRGDCLSVIGVAREVAARYGVQLKETAVRPEEQLRDPIKNAITVSIEDPAGCPRYAGRLIRGVTIQPSPEWMQRRLTLAGLRPINNIVDITNYLMLHYGQPMHAFDYNLISGRKIIVKKAGKPLSFVTLDNARRELSAADLLICDGERPVALAGIMGGAGSEISDATRDVFLECAFFDPGTIRMTSKRLGLSTDASYRFERGVDPESGLIDALDTAAGLIVKCGGGTVASGRVDTYPKRFERRTIAVRPSRVSKVLGQRFEDGKITGFLASLGFTCTQKGPDTIHCTVPLYRHDLEIEEDLIEEVGRLYGYDAIPAALYARVFLSNQLPETEHAADTVRHAMAYSGFNEIVTNSMTSEKRRALLTPDRKPVVLLNPLSPDMAQMRTTLAGSMLEVLAYNLNRKNSDNKFFEVGKTYEILSSGERCEHDVLGILIESNWTPAAWNTAEGLPCGYYILKGILETFASYTGAGHPRIFPKAEGLPALFDSEAASVMLGESIQGVTGTIAKNVLDHFDIKTKTYYTELDITGFLTSPLPRPQYKPLPRFPALERDFCFVMPEHLSAGAISDEIFRVSPLVAEVRPFDLYRDQKLGSNIKSIAFGVSLRSNEKTLTDKDVEGLCATLIRTIQEKFGAKLRT